MCVTACCRSEIIVQTFRRLEDATEQYKLTVID